ncbi:MAG: FeoB-associated Cys-rich membrane protein [Prevotella sp.]|nr:FeoB-associated Cys-rich membrane protein [Prevotella sp.]
MEAQTIQYVLVAVFLLLSVGYAVYRIRKAILQADDPCAGCAGCVLREQRRKQVAEQQKKHEKPACFKKK